MKNSILMGSAVLAIALLPSFASAASASYDLDVGAFQILSLPGGLLDVPDPLLDQTEGTAVIAGMAYVPTESVWLVNVLCVASSTGHCKGQAVN